MKNHGQISAQTRSQDNLLSQNEARLSEILEGQNLGFTPEQFSLSVHSAWNSGTITTATLSEQRFNYRVNAGPDHLYGLLIHACVANLLARRAIADNATDLAWAHIVDGSFVLGEAVTHAYYAMKNRTTSESGTTIQAKGGQAKAAKSQLAKNEAIRLMKEKRPAGGWRDASEAFDAIDGELRSFVRQKSIRLLETNLPTTMKNWLKTDASFREDFLKI